MIGLRRSEEVILDEVDRQVEAGGGLFVGPAMSCVSCPYLFLGKRLALARKAKAGTVTGTKMIPIVFGKSCFALLFERLRLMVD